MPPNKKTDLPAPRIALTCGDTAGIGPEVVRAVAGDRSVLEACRPVLFWPRSRPGPGVDAEVQDVGKPGATPAEAALASLEAALGAVRSGLCDGLVTAPVSKERMDAVLPGFRGHTEWLAGMCGVPVGAVLMVFGGPRVRTACVTRHVPLGRVPALLGREDIARAALLLWGHLRFDLGLGSPGIAVTAVNPHASEGGLLGTEERDVIAPAVLSATRALELLGGGGGITGPHAADSAFRDHVLGRYDAVLAMFHDQATVAAKLVDPFRSVNVTAGLPIVRTSPDHGTADDLAGKGRADPGSMREAVLLAARLAARNPALRHVLRDLDRALASVS